jgi:DNA polymerase-3 subunit epsilon
LSNWLARLVAGRGERRQPPDQDAAAAVAAWKALAPADPERALFDARLVVVNTEASGLDLERDRLLAVGAVAVDGGLISAQQAYYAPLEPQPAQTLATLLAFVGNSPVVAFNTLFHRTLLARNFGAALDLEPELIWLDLHYLLPALFPERSRDPLRLAAWMRSFGIETFQRHHGLGDGWAVAQLFQAAQARALGRGAANARALGEIEQAYRAYRREP